MRKLFGVFIVFALIGGVFSGCSDDNDEDTKIYQLTVASVQRIMFISDHFSPYLVKYDGKGAWESFPYITDFQHEEGYEYVILVEQKRVRSDDWIGGSPYEITLINQISKTKKDSQNLPLQRGNFIIASKKTGDEALPYYVLSNRTGRWEKFPSIKDFQHEEGYEYELTLDCEYRGLEASPKYSYTCIKISREKRDSQGLPE